MSFNFEDDEFYEENSKKSLESDLDSVVDNLDTPIEGSSADNGEDVETESEMTSPLSEKGSVEDIGKNQEKSLSTDDGEIVDEASLAKTQTLRLDDDDEGFGLDDEDVEDDGDVLSPEERLRGFSDEVLSCCVGKKEINKYALNKLMSITNPRLFRDENYIIFTVLYNYRSKLKNIDIDEEFLKLYLNRNRGILDKARGYIDINAYGEVDGSVELGYIAGVVKHFRRLEGMNELSEEEFDTAFEKYLIEFKAMEASKVYNQSALILTEGMKVGKKELSGFDDSYNFARKRLAEIEGLVDMNMGSGFTKMSEVIMEEKEDGRKPYKISDFGRLEKLNEIFNGIYTGMFYQIIAPPKAGKTKLCARICHTTSVIYGNNVTVWAQEGGKDAWTAQMRAIHFDYTYNQGASITDRKTGVSQETILKDTFATDELRQLEMSSKLDLASNENYGSVDFIDRPFEVETFLDDIDTSVKENNSKLIIIDYLQLIGSNNGMPERERIAEAYKELLKYCKTNNVAVLTPGQYKQEAFNALIAKGNTNDADMRTAGGGSSEVLRTPDVIFALWATTQDLLNNTMKILSVPSRMNRVFPEITVHMDLGTCQFISVDE